MNIYSYCEGTQTLAWYHDIRCYFNSFDIKCDQSNCNLMKPKHVTLDMTTRAPPPHFQGWKPPYADISSLYYIQCTDDT